MFSAVAVAAMVTPRALGAQSQGAETPAMPTVVPSHRGSRAISSRAKSTPS